MKHLVSIVVLVFLLLSLAKDGLVQAQGEAVVLSQLRIDLWPEHDRPNMLVIYKAVLGSDVTLPVSLTFRIPAAAGEPNGVAYPVEGEAKPLNLPYTRSVRGEWALITFTTITPEIHLEYYDPALEKTGIGRHFVYRWPGDYAVMDFTIEVQQPMGATNLSLSPGASKTTQSPAGLTYFIKDVGQIQAGQSFDLTIDYQKASDVLNIEAMQVEPSEPITLETPGRINLQDSLPWLLGALGVILIVGGGVWYWQSGRGGGGTAPKVNRRGGRGQPKPASVPEEIEIYCHQCGKRANSGDRFCRSCGTKLRTE